MEDEQKRLHPPKQQQIPDTVLPDLPADYKPKFSINPVDHIGEKNHPLHSTIYKVSDLPVKERKKYIDGHQDPKHESMTQIDYTCNCHGKKIKEENDKKLLIEQQAKQISDQQQQILAISKHMAEMTDQLNKLTLRDVSGL